ncbi:MAG: hypothetical protein ACP5NS_00705 [Candidatus Pacearchaeota archaeon]
MDRLRKIVLGAMTLALLGTSAYGGWKLWKNRDIEPLIERYVEFDVDGKKVMVPDYFFGKDDNGKQLLECSRNARWTSKRLGLEGFARCNAWERPLKDSVVASNYNGLENELRNSEKLPTGTIVGVRVDDPAHHDDNKTYDFTHNGTILQGKRITVEGRTYQGPVILHSVGNDFCVDTPKSLRGKGWPVVKAFMPQTYTPSKYNQ